MIEVNKELFQQVAAIVGDKNITPQRASTFAERARLYGLYKRGTLGKLLGPYGTFMTYICVCISGDFAVDSIILIIAIQFYSRCSITSPDDDDVDTEQRPSSRPGILSIEARSKYDAWLETQSLTKQEARQEYVKLALELVGEPVQKLVDTA